MIESNPRAEVRVSRRSRIRALVCGVLAIGAWTAMDDTPASAAESYAIAMHGAPAAGGAAAGGVAWAADGGATGAGFGAAFLAFGAAAGAGAGADCCAWTSVATSEATNAVAANQAKTRPRGWTDAAKIRKFIAENPF